MLQPAQYGEHFIALLKRKVELKEKTRRIFHPDLAVYERLEVARVVPEVLKRALGHLVHHEREFQQVVNREVRLKFTPQLRFVLDHSLEKGDETLAIINQLEANGQA